MRRKPFWPPYLRLPTLVCMGYYLEKAPRHSLNEINGTSYAKYVCMSFDEAAWVYYTVTSMKPTKVLINDQTINADSRNFIHRREI